MPIPVPDGYLTLSGAYAAIRSRTGFGRLIIDNMLDKMEAAGTIQLLNHPAHKQAKIISAEDVEKVVIALTTVSPHRARRGDA